MLHFQSLLPVLLGRESELHALWHHLQSGTPLVTVVGPAGVGKTLLLDHLHHLLLQQGHPVVRLDLLQDPPWPQLDGPALVLLDHLEVRPEAAEQVKTWLQQGVQVLVGSRFPLKIRLEQRFPLSPLPCQQLEDAVVQLFVQQARSVQPQFEAGHHPELLLEVCQRLEGLPLALELGARQLAVLSLQGLLERLKAHQTLPLAHGADVPPRQASLQALTRSSHALLDPALQQVFCGLALLAGDWDAPFAAHIVHPNGLGMDSLQAIATLAEKNLLVALPEHQPPRFRFLEVHRSFALDGLTPEQANALWTRYTDHLQGLLLHFEEQYEQDPQPQLLDTLEPHLHHFEHVLSHLLGPGATPEQVHTAYDMVRVLQCLWHDRGHFSQLRHWMGRVLDHPHELGRREQIIALNAMSNACGEQGDLETSATLLQRAIGLLGPDLPELYQAILQNNLGVRLQELGQHQAARTALDLALQVYDRCDHQAGVTQVLGNIGLLCTQQGLFEEAALHLQQSEQRAREQQEAYLLASCQQNQSHLAALLGDGARATECAAEALEGMRLLDHVVGTANCLALLAQGHLLSGTTCGVLALLQESLELCQTHQIRQVEAQVHLLLAEHHRLQGDFAGSWLAVQQGMELARQHQLHALWLTASTDASRLLLQADLSSLAVRVLACGETFRQTHEVQLGRPLQKQRDGLLQSLQGQAGWEEGLKASPVSVTHEVLHTTPGFHSVPNPLSRREQQVLALLGAGLTNKQIARKVQLSEHTVRHHVVSICRKLDCSTRAAAVSIALQNGWMTTLQPEN